DNLILIGGHILQRPPQLLQMRCSKKRLATNSIRQTGRRRRRLSRQRAGIAPLLTKPEIQRLAIIRQQHLRLFQQSEESAAGLLIAMYQSNAARLEMSGIGSQFSSIGMGREAILGNGTAHHNLLVLKLQDILFLLRNIQQTLPW